MVVASAGAETIEDIARVMHQLVRSHAGRFELPELTDEERAGCLRRAVVDAVTRAGFPLELELFDGEQAMLDADVDSRYLSYQHQARVSMLAPETRQEVERRRRCASVASSLTVADVAAAMAAP